MSTRALKSIIRRNLCGWKSRGFTTRCKALVRLKNRKSSERITRKHLKEHAEFWKNAKKKKNLWTEETKIILHQNEGKRVEKERNSKSSVKHGVVMLWHMRLCLPVEPGHCWLLMMWLLLEAEDEYSLLRFSKCCKTDQTLLHSENVPKAY